MIRLLTQTRLPKPRYLEVALRNYEDANARDVFAVFHYVNVVDAQTVARTIMVDIMERIACERIQRVVGWQFRHHDKAKRSLLPSDMGPTSRPAGERHLRAAAGKAAHHIRAALKNKEQQNYKPDYVVVDARNEGGNAEAEQLARHRLWVQWDPEKETAGFSARIYVWSPLTEKESTTPFFTLESLKTYVEVD